MGHFQVLFSGEIAPGANEARAKAALAQHLGVDERKAAQLFSGRTVVLRSDLNQDEAFALQTELRHLGVIARVKDRTPVVKDNLTLAERIKDDNKRHDATLKDITAAHFECPRCGFLQLEAEFCSRCGVNIAQAMREKKREDMLIEKQIRDLREKQNQLAAQHSRHGLAADARKLQSGQRPESFRNASSQIQPEAPPKSRLGKAGAWLRNLIS